MLLAILNELLLLMTRELLIQYIRRHTAFSLALASNRLATFLGGASRMIGRVCIRIGNNDLIILSLHNHILLHVLHLAHLHLHIIIFMVVLRSVGVNRARNLILLLVIVIQR